MIYSVLPAGISNCLPCKPVPAVPALAVTHCFMMKVEGIGNVRVQPDMAVVVLGVVTESNQLEQAQRENTTRMTAILGVLREKGIPPEDIQTRSYNITPQYDFIEGKQVFRGYRVEHLIEITVRELGRVGEIIDAAVQKGANRVDSVSFSIEKPQLYYRQALNAAVEDALGKAATLGNKLNLEVFQVPVRIIETGYEPEVPVIPLTYQTAVSTTPVQTGSIEITARIEAVFAYGKHGGNSFSSAG